MIDSTFIDKAVMAHKEWKQRLEYAIRSGKSDFSPEIVKTDNACEFGRWLNSLPDSEKITADYKTVKELHAEFHKVAGDILQLALSGKRDEAIAKISFGGTYGLASSKLTNALYEWKKKL